MRIGRHTLSGFFAIACVIAFVSSASAASTITMEQAIASAMNANPSILAAAQRAVAAHARPPQAATPPDPNFMVQFGQVPINTIDIDQGTKTYMVQQKIPFPSKLVYGYKAEKRAAEALDEHRKMTAQEIVRRVKLAYLNAYRLQEEARVERSALTVLRTNKASAEEAYAADEASLADPPFAPPWTWAMWRDGWQRSNRNASRRSPRLLTSWPRRLIPKRV